MKKILIFFYIFFYFSTNLFSQEYKLEKIVDGLDKPWSLSFIDKENIDDFLTNLRTCPKLPGASRHIHPVIHRVIHRICGLFIGTVTVLIAPLLPPKLAVEYSSRAPNL